MNCHRRYWLSIQLKLRKEWMPFTMHHWSPAEHNIAKECTGSLRNSSNIRKSVLIHYLIVVTFVGVSLLMERHRSLWNIFKLMSVMNYGTLNRLAKRNKAHIPEICPGFGRIGGAWDFPRLYVKTGFHILSKPEDFEYIDFNAIDRTSVRSILVFCKSYGLLQRTATFQNLMNNIFLDYIDGFLVLYIDDLLIFSKYLVLHYLFLEIVLRRLK